MQRDAYTLALTADLTCACVPGDTWAESSLSTLLLWVFSDLGSSHSVFRSYCGCERLASLNVCWVKGGEGWGLRVHTENVVFEGFGYRMESQQ